MSFRPRTKPRTGLGEKANDKVERLKSDPSTRLVKRKVDKSFISTSKPLPKSTKQRGFNI